MRQFVFCAVVLAFLASASANRGIGPIYEKAKMCCSLPELITDEIKSKCTRTHTPKSDNGLETVKSDNSTQLYRRSDVPVHGRWAKRRNSFKRSNTCFASCALNETGILVKGQLEEAKLLEYLNLTLSGQPELVPFLEETFKSCSSALHYRQTRVSKRFHHIKLSSHACGHQSHAASLMRCVFTRTFRNCPTSRWTDTEVCNEWRDADLFGRGRGGRMHSES